MAYMIKEIFQTVQGEGKRTDEESTFVRFTGCNLWSGKTETRYKGRGACAFWCDTAFATGERYKNTDEVLLHMEQARAECDMFAKDKSQKWCVLTGGEPLLQVDMALVDCLHSEGWMIAVETNGTVANEVADEIDWMCVSPKLDHEGRLGNLKIVKGHEMKVVVPGAVSGLLGWTTQRLLDLQRATDFENYYVQPQDPIVKTSTNKSYLVGSYAEGEYPYNARLSFCREFVDKNPGWQVSIQTHKEQGIR
tara:strand:+ start:2156 stop:2905 length:750 start_codon:yes stop_codon:yes gene_type:complete